MTVTQATFHDALLDAAKPIPKGLSDAQDRAAGRRFSVYRNNVAVSLTEAMHQAFPVVTKLLGAQNMDGLAGIYLRRHPPVSPLMMHYGETFPEFLEGMEQLAHLGYLPDVARLELALRRSYHAADSTPIAPAALAVDTGALLTARLTFSPSTEILRSDWPVHAIWRFNTDDDAPKPQAGGQDILIVRPEFDPVPHLLPAGGADWIEAMHAGKTIGEAHELALSRAEDFDLGVPLSLLLQGNAITSMTTERPLS